MTRSEAFNAKRHERIVGAGVDTTSITRATVSLAGRDEDNCALCDHAIQWMFALSIESGTGAKTIAPVGSTCIRTWAEALPATDGQRAILDALKIAEDEMSAVKARFKSINSMEKRGRISEEQAAALLRFYSASQRIRENSFLADVASKVIRYDGFVGRQWDSWSKALQQDIANANAPKCGRCGSQTRARSGRFGAFYGCVKYSEGCRWTQNIKWERPAKSADEDIDAPESTPTTPTTPTADYDGDDLPF